MRESGVGVLAPLLVGGLVTRISSSNTY